MASTAEATSDILTLRTMILDNMQFGNSGTHCRREDFAIVTIADTNGRVAAMITMGSQPILRSGRYAIPESEQNLRIDTLSVLASAYGDLAKHVAMRAWDKLEEDGTTNVLVIPRTSDDPPGYEA